MRAGSQRGFSLKRITTLSWRNQLTSTARRAFCRHGCQSWGRWQALRAARQEQQGRACSLQGSACSLHASATAGSSAMLCHEGLQDTQAAPGGHFSAMEQEANSHHLPEAKRNPSEGLQPKKTPKTLIRSICTQKEQNFQRGESSVPAESVPRNISN